MVEVYLFFLGLVVMEPITYLSHRYIFHGFGVPLHRSHHSSHNRREGQKKLIHNFAPKSNGWELNDFYPGISALITMSVIALGIFVPSLKYLISFGFGITAYGLLYFLIHDIVVHGRIPFFRIKKNIFSWHYHSHRIHHLFGGEPYGLLFPIVPSALKKRYHQLTLKNSSHE